MKTLKKKKKLEMNPLSSWGSRHLENHQKGGDVSPKITRGSLVGPMGREKGEEGRTQREQRHRERQEAAISEILLTQKAS